MRWRLSFSACLRADRTVHPTKELDAMTLSRRPASSMLRASLPLFAAAALGACGDDGATTGLKLDFDPVSTASALSTGLVVAPEFDVTRFEVLVREVKLLPDKNANESDDARFQAKGTFTINVLDPAASTTPVIEVPDETYKKVELKFGKPDAGEGLDGEGWALVLDAVIGDADSDADYNVELRLEDLEKLTLRDVDGLALAGGDVGTFLVNLDVVSWFAGVDLAELDADGDGSIRIDKDSAKAAHDDIAKAIKDNIKLVRKP